MESQSLNALADELLAEARSAHAGRAAHTIHGGHTHRLRQTMVALLGGRSLGEHDSPDEGTLQVLSGEVVLDTGSEAWHGSAGDLLVLPSARHTLDATTDAVILLTVAMRIDRAGND